MENTIPVICRTNLDDYDCTEITELLCPPVKGDYIMVRKRGKTERYKLKIVSITHCKGYLDIELHN